MLLGRRALYLQVRDVLAQRIANGEWRPGFAVPNENDLAREIGVSSGTVRKALNLVEAQQLITRRPGHGTFVNDPASDELAARFSRLRSAAGERLCGQIKSQVISEDVANERERARLQLGARDRVYRIRRVRHHRGRNVLVADVSLPVALFPGLARKSDVVDRTRVLAAQYGLLLGHAEERISICAPPADVRDHFDIASGSLVMFLDRVLFTLDGHRPAEWRIAYLHLPDGYYLAELN